MTDSPMSLQPPPPDPEDVAVIATDRPRHIAIIMDGNGRWATQQGLNRIDGHHAGAKAVRGIVEACRELGIEYLTLYSFSTENWRRPEQEVAALMALLQEYLRREEEELIKNGVRFNTIGDLSALPESVQQAITHLTAATATCTGPTLTLALNYGSRQEIAAAATAVAQAVVDGRAAIEDITPDLLAKHLGTTDLPDPDLLIRTAGEQRISNFLLWQLSYTELWFTDLCWPDFTAETLQDAITAYGERVRRYGAVVE